jgi:hypothetical protein
MPAVIMMSPLVLYCIAFLISETSIDCYRQTPLEVSDNFTPQIPDLIYFGIGLKKIGFKDIDS